MKTEKASMCFDIYLLNIQIQWLLSVNCYLFINQICLDLISNVTVKILSNVLIESVFADYISFSLENKTEWFLWLTRQKTTSFATLCAVGWSYCLREVFRSHTQLLSLINPTAIKDEER